MRVPTSAAFNQFLLENSHYPFNRLKATRNSFFCKWIMLKGTSHLGLVYYFPVMANSIRNVELLVLISSEHAKPFPPELSHVMDNMYWWGHSRSHLWFEQVIDAMGVLLDNVNNNEFDEQQREIVREFIAYEVKQIILGHFDLMSVPFDIVFDQWWYHFNCAYRKGDFVVGGRYTFRQIAESSFEYVEWLIGEVEADVEDEEERLEAIAKDDENSNGCFVAEVVMS
jgi:hypothetical protein